MFKFLIIFIAIIYLFGYLGRMFLSRWVKKMQNNGPNQQYQQSSRPEGDVTINNAASKKKAFDSSDGDYVDYEEVK